MEHYEGRSSITLDKDFELPETPPGTIRLNLACGTRSKLGFIGVDNSENLEYSLYPPPPGEPFIGYRVQDLERSSIVRWDLTQTPWPFPTESVYEVWCSHYIEHTLDLEEFMKELYRVLIPMGIATLSGPYYTSVEAHQDYTHKRSLTEFTIKYFNQDWLKINKLDKVYSRHGVNFEAVNTVFLYTNEWASRADEAKAYALKHYMNVVSDITYVVRKRV